MLFSSLIIDLALPVIRNNFTSYAIRFTFCTRKPLGYTQRGALCESILDS
jgi:hypothetical protein